MAMGAVLVVAGRAGPDRPDFRQAALAAAEPMIGLRDGPDGILPSILPKGADAAILTKRPQPRRQKPFIDLSPVETRLNEEGFRLIAETEGLRLKAYYLADQWLVGYGHARIAYEGLEITRAEAEALLHRDIHEVERGLAKLLTVPVNENEYAALVSLAYNLGLGGFQRSLVYQRLAMGDREGAADAFRYLTTARVNGVRTELPVLVARRARERALFLMPVASDILEADAFDSAEPTDALSDI
jgi:lysozyme